jgi:hypothetical protein
MLLRHFSVVLGVCVLASISGALSQSPYQTDGTGSIRIISDASVQRAVTKITEGEIRQKGYRVQVVAESGAGSKDRALKARIDFQHKFPGIPCYITYEAPNFKVRAGDFLTFLEAAALCEKVRVFYPTAYVVEDQIWVVSPRKQRE